MNGKVVKMKRSNEPTLESESFYANTSSAELKPKILDLEKKEPDRSL